jgi:hypothetical protein
MLVKFRSFILSNIFPNAKHIRSIIKLCPTSNRGTEINKRKFASDLEKNTTAKKVEKIT